MSFFSNRWLKFLLSVVVFCVFLITIRSVYTLPPPPSPPTYSITAHGNSSSGVNRSAVTGSPYPDASPYAVGHCGHCHEMHASIGGGEPPPTGDTENLYNLFKENYGSTYKNELCFACHETFNFTGTPDPPLGYGRYYVYSGKTNYNNSSHKTSGSMTWPLTPPPGPTYLDAGNCNNCHNPHGYDDGSGVIPSMIFKREELLCFECHDGSPAVKDIKTRVSSDAYRHDVANTNYRNKHLAGTQDTFANISANKHVECVDCHNPHMAASGLHTAGTTGNSVSNLIKGVLGAVTTFSTSNWTVPTSYTLNIATKEYEICFKCHSSANTNYLTWGGTGAASWTNVGLEFSSGNKSGHPIVTGLNNYTNSPAPKPLTAARMVSPWNVNLGTQTMYCSDCHNYTTTTPAGPHGSSVKWMLSGTNRAWPYTTTAGNGTSTGTYFTLNTYSSGTAPNTLFCRNCHTIMPGTPNTVHDTGNHKDYKCVNCHIRVPHGGKVSRLFNADNPGTGLPARYYPDGNGAGGLGTNRMKYFNKKAPTSYAKADCNAACYGSHNAGSGETW